MIQKQKSIRYKGLHIARVIKCLRNGEYESIHAIEFMKNKTLMILIIVIIFEPILTIALNNFYLKQTEGSQNAREILYYDNKSQSEIKNKYGLNGRQLSTIVKDEKTAEELAEIILKAAYGEEKIKEQKPLIVKYDEECQVWVVSGTLAEGSIGGVANVIIKGQTGEIVAIWHTK